ncbi:hypothetical protein [Pontibacter rugosus]
MSIMQQVRERIEQTQPGQLLTYAYFQINDHQLEALAAALSRLTKQGVINRLPHSPTWSRSSSRAAPRYQRPTT